MKDFLAIAAGVIGFFGVVPYIMGILKGKAKPNIASWSTWMIISAVVTAAAISEHAYESAILTGTNAAALFFVVILGIWRGTRKYTIFDAICQVLALVGLVLWQTLDAAYLAIAIGVIADLIASLPTLRHAYLQPNEETWLAYVIGGSAALISFVAVADITFSSVAFPLTLFLSNLSIVSTILIRRKQIEAT